MGDITSNLIGSNLGGKGKRSGCYAASTIQMLQFQKIVCGPTDIAGLKMKRQVVLNPKYRQIHLLIDFYVVSPALCREFRFYVIPD